MRMRVRSAAGAAVVALLLAGCAATGGMSNTASGQAGFNANLGGPSGLTLQSGASGSNSTLGLGGASLGPGKTATTR